MHDSAHAIFSQYLGAGTVGGDGNELIRLILCGGDMKSDNWLRQCAIYIQICNFQFLVLFSPVDYFISSPPAIRLIC